MSYQGNSSFNHESESIDDLRTRLDRMTRWSEHQEEQIRSHEKEKKLLIEQNFDLKCDKEDLIKKLSEVSARPTDLNSAELTRRREQAEEQRSTIATLSAKLLAAERKEAQSKKFMLEFAAQQEKLAAHQKKLAARQKELVVEQDELAAQQEEHAIRIRTTIDPPSNMLAENVEDPPGYGFGNLTAMLKGPKRQDLGDIIEDQQPAKPQAAKSAAKASGDGKSESPTVRSYTSKSSEQPGGLPLSGRHYEPSTENADSSVSKDVEESVGSTKDEDSKKADLLNPPKLSSPKEKLVTSANAEARTDPGRRETPTIIRKIIAKNLEKEQQKVKRGLFQIKDEESMEGASGTSPISLQQSPASSSSKSLPAPPTITVAADVRGANRSHGQSKGQTDKGLTGTIIHETTGQSKTFAEATRVKSSEPKEREPRTYLFSGIREEPAPPAEDLSTAEAGKLKTDTRSPPSDNKAVVAQGSQVSSSKQEDVPPKGQAAIERQGPEIASRQQEQLPPKEHGTSGEAGGSQSGPSREKKIGAKDQALTGSPKTVQSPKPEHSKAAVKNTLTAGQRKRGKRQAKVEKAKEAGGVPIGSESLSGSPEAASEAKTQPEQGKAPKPKQTALETKGKDSPQQGTEAGTKASSQTQQQAQPMGQFRKESKQSTRRASASHDKKSLNPSAPNFQPGHSQEPSVLGVLSELGKERILGTTRSPKQTASETGKTEPADLKGGLESTKPKLSLNLDKPLRKASIIPFPKELAESVDIGALSPMTPSDEEAEPGPAPPQRKDHHDTVADPLQLTPAEKFSWDEEVEESLAVKAQELGKPDAEPPKADICGLQPSSSAMTTTGNQGETKVAQMSRNWRKR